jgi:UDP-N-acetylglucosamine 4,6-dehydratase
MKSILITGGSGFLGRGLVRRCLADHHFERVCILSRDEHKHAAMQKQFADDDRLRFFIGDVRDRGRLRRALEGVQTVVHAAALKRIQTGFYNPTEMVQTNVLGAINVIEAAMDAGVARILAISSDKAWQPCSPYGQTKALAESLFLAANGTGGASGPACAVVRYGNVVGSTGSVVPTWREMISQGHKTVPVTDLGCSRFWMHLDEAVALVLRTLQTMKGGELVIPDSLPAFYVGDLAQAMNVDVDEKGLPAWEKLHEGLRDGMTSDIARRMSVREIKEELKHVW